MARAATAHGPSCDCQRRELPQDRIELGLIVDGASPSLAEMARRNLTRLAVEAACAAKARRVPPR